MSHRISVIIPVINEVQTIASLLQHLIDTAFAKAHIAEIIVADGGSSDGTCDEVKRFINRSDITVHHTSSKKGRAVQMNTGARLATGDILYFLHADTFPPNAYDQLIIAQVAAGNPAGCFKMRFDSNHWWLRLAGWLTQFKWRPCRGGDQSQFITRALYDEIGGYDEQFIIYEDNDLINKLYARKKYVVIQEWLTTSARRYEENGVWRLQYYFWSIYVRKWFGASAEDLLDYYKRKVS